MSQNDKGWRGVKNQSKKCHVLFEWPLTTNSMKLYLETRVPSDTIPDVWENAHFSINIVTNCRKGKLVLVFQYLGFAKTSKLVFGLHYPILICAQYFKQDTLAVKMFKISTNFMFTTIEWVSEYFEGHPTFYVNNSEFIKLKEFFS